MNITEFQNCLHKGFIDYQTAADAHYIPRLLTNNAAREEKVLDKILLQLDLCDSFFFSVAFVTKSGVACLKDKLLELEARQVKGRILASQYLNFTEPGALRELLKFKNIQVRMLPEEKAFHAKGYGFIFPEVEGRVENCTMIVGSSNLTANALTRNQEWNLFLTSTKNGDLLRQIQSEFETLWQKAGLVNEDWLKLYDIIYRKNYQAPLAYRPRQEIKPNQMQEEALQGIQHLRDEKEDRALIISATGTGKTFLSAFDVARFKPGRFLFLVHRELIAAASKSSFEKVFCDPGETGLLSGSSKDKDKKYLFSTVQTMSRDEVLHSFEPRTFDYIVVDEVHHSGADTYQKLFNYFQPKFWLGMTATPERTDGYDIFDLFHHNIAYEIRLQRALAEDMLVPFHYHGISEIEVDGKLLDDKSQFNDLVCEARVDHILQYADFYGSDGERVKGLVFCSRREEARTLAAKFLERGKRARALDGDTPEAERESAIEELEQDGYGPNYLDYIFTVDIFNEGVDIPKVNQIIMLRPTQSAIVFVQQLGRGLRKAPQKRYIEVLDFIGNYENNFLLPIALYGDRSYNKDNVRRLLTRNVLPGASTIHFDDITKEKIFASIDSKKYLADYQELKKAYKDMQFRLGRRPLMMDFVRQGDKDPYLFIEKKESYYNFVQAVESDPETTLTQPQRAVLTMVSLELASGKRVEELALLQNLLKKSSATVAGLTAEVEAAYHYKVAEETWFSVYQVLSLNFFVQKAQKKYANLPLVVLTDGTFTLSPALGEMLSNHEFVTYFEDVLAYGCSRFEKMYQADKYVQGFVRYEKYTRKDVCRILQRDHDTSAVLYGYRILGDNCPIFVTYEKSDDISERTKYEDQFISPRQFSWMTRSGVRLATSSEVTAINKAATRKLLFIKKSDNEGSDFYYLGELSLAADVVPNPVQREMKDDKGKVLPVVNYQFVLDKPVDDKLYAYLNTVTTTGKSSGVGAAEGRAQDTGESSYTFGEDQATHKLAAEEQSLFKV